MMWSPFMCLMALSSVINLPIYSFYPNAKARYTPNLFNAKIFPRQASAAFVSPLIDLFWSLSGINENDINPMFITNHVVVLFVVNKNMLIPLDSESYILLFKSSRLKRTLSEIFEISEISK